VDYSRREWCFLLPALLAQVHPASASDQVLPAEAYPFRGLTAHAEGKNTFRPVFDGETHSRYHIELHETALAPGGAPHPPHHHVHEEIFMIRQGDLDVTIAGKTTRLGSGGVAYVASNVEHGIRNGGHMRAQYFVLALGSDHV
jgi:mannose-6-phosphate isomerase-like protein (cupin superfamily)